MTETLGQAIVLGTFEAGSPEWLAARKCSGTMVGQLAMDAVAKIDGMAPSAYSSPWDLWTERVDGLRKKQTLPMRRGSHMEPLILEVAAEEWGDIRPYKASLQHPDHAWATCNLDGVLYVDDRPVALVECKDVSPLSRWKWREGPPTMYLAQCQWQMWVTGIPETILAVWFGSEVQYFRVYSDDDDALWLYDIARDFWELVETRTPPPLDDSPRCLEHVARAWTEGETTAELKSKAAYDYAQACADIKDAEARKRAAEALLWSELDGHKRGKYPGGTVTVVQKHRLDRDAIFREHGDLARQHMVERFDERAFKRAHPKIAEAHKIAANPYLMHRAKKEKKNG